MLGSKLINFFPLHHGAEGNLVPGPGIKLAPSAMKAQSLIHWTAGEFLQINIFLKKDSCKKCVVKLCYEADLKQGNTTLSIN